MGKEKIDNFKIYSYNAEHFKNLLIMYEKYVDNFDSLSEGLALKPMNESDFYESLLTYSDDWSNRWLNKPNGYIKKPEILTLLLNHSNGLMNINKIKEYLKVYKIEREIIKQININ